MSLYAHQKNIIDEDPKYAGLFLGTGSGKTTIALLLARGATLVVAPKTQTLDQNWQREVKKLKLDINLTVISKEAFRRDHAMMRAYDTVIFEEAHTILGATPNVKWKNKRPTPKMSQLLEAAFAYIERTKPARLYLVTATPTRTPMCVWAAGVLLGKKWNFYSFRDAFYVRLPMPGREVWVPRKDTETKERLGAAVQKIGYVGRLSDWFDVPEQTHRVVRVGLTAEQKRMIAELPLQYPDPLICLGKKHQVENGILMQDLEDVVYFKNEKMDKITALVEEFPKVLIFAKYKAQVRRIEEEMHRVGIRTFVLTGDTKDRKVLIANAESNERCVFIAQSQVSAGYELPSFRCTIFASTSYSHVDLEQARGRTLRANALNKNLYVYLLAGNIDKAVWDALEHKKDFSEAAYLKKLST